MTFLSGINSDEMIKLRSVEIESRSVGWINCPIIGNVKIIIIISILKWMLDIQGENVFYFKNADSDSLYIVI